MNGNAALPEGRAGLGIPVHCPLPAGIRYIVLPEQGGLVYLVVPSLLLNSMCMRHAEGCHRVVVLGVKQLCNLCPAGRQLLVSTHCWQAIQEYEMREAEKRNLERGHTSGQSASASA